MNKLPENERQANLTILRKLLHEALSRPAASPKQAHTQVELARKIGLSPAELSLRLNSGRGRKLSAADVQRIVMVLAEWGAVDGLAARHLLRLGGAQLDEAAWQEPPLANLPHRNHPIDLAPAPALNVQVRELDRFRTRLRELYRRADPYADGRKPTQGDLAAAIGLSAVELSKRLHDKDGRRLSDIDGRAIVRTLAEWGAITTRAEAEELIALLAIPGFSVAEWQSPPLDELSLAPTSTTPHNLPRLLNRFIGRQAELASGPQRIGQGGLVTLTGSGGIGKTRLSLELGARMLAEFKDGVYFVALDRLSAADFVPQAIAAVLGCAEEPGRSINATLVRQLAKKRLLLILDNCEHLSQAVAILAAELLSNCPYLVILATSRQRLAVAGEQVWPLSSLAVPSLRMAAANEIATYDAVQLFAATAQMAWPDFTLDDVNSMAVAAICRSLDGIPLAIEMAAALVRAMSVAQIATRLHDHFGLLRRDTATTPSRQQTLTASIRWSYDLLSEAEQQLLRRLAVFSGEFALEAVEAVCADDILPSTNIASLIVALVNKSLVTTVAADNTLRYRLLQPIHEFAQERLTERGEDEAVRRRHAQLYLALGEQFALNVDAEAREWLDRLELEHDNIRAALMWLQEHEAALAARLALSLIEFWTMRGYVSEGYQYLIALLGRNDLTRPTRLLLLYETAHFASVVGDYTQANAYNEQGIGLATVLGDQARLARLYNQCGIVAQMQADLAAARQHYQAAFDIGLRLDNKQMIATYRGNLAAITFVSGDYAAARQGHEQNLTLNREIGDPSMIAYTQIFIADAATMLGDYAAARAAYQVALDLHRRTDYRRGVLSAKLGMAELAGLEGDYATAHQLYALIVPEQRERSYTRDLAIALCGMASLALSEGEAIQAHRYAAEAATLLSTLGDKWTLARALTHLAVSIVRTDGDRYHATALLALADKLLEATGGQLFPFVRTAYQEQLAQLQATMLPPDFNAAWQMGQTLELSEIANYATRQLAAV